MCVVCLLYVICMLFCITGTLAGVTSSYISFSHQHRPASPTEGYIYGRSILKNEKEGNFRRVAEKSTKTRIET